MTKSYSPKEFTEYIRKAIPGSDYDPLGIEELKAMVKRSSAEAGDPLAQAELEIQAEIQKAHEDLESFRGYLRDHQLSDDAINQRLGELEIFYDESSQSAVIARPDRQPFELNLAELGLTGELPLPKQLRISSLYCDNNQLTTLPVLPQSLTELDCGNNQLTTLPDLPQSLTVLWCGKNQLTALPDLPQRLTALSCPSNLLTALPDLPQSLTELNCGYNRLTPEAKQAVIEQQKTRGFRLESI